MKHIALLLSFALALATGAQTDDGSGILFGKDYSFALQAPPEWVLDNSSGKLQGLSAVFYPAGSSWGESDRIMYANTATKMEGLQTVEELIAYNAGRFKRLAPGLRVTELPAIATRDEKKATVRRFAGDQHGNHEAVAYIEEKKTIVMLVLSARTEEGFVESYAAFEKLVGSYYFLTDSVVFK